MKNLITLSILLYSFIALGQNCKPDLKNTDKVTKQPNVAWQTELYESSFGNSLVNTSNWRINFQLGRYTQNHLLSIFINKYEESVQAAAFESQYKGIEGTPFVLAFSSGSPLTFVVTSAVNNTQMDNLNGRLVTTITLSVKLTPDEIEQIRKSFSAGKLNAIRCNLANNITIDETVKEKRADKVYEKVKCFLDYIDKTPLPVVTPTETTSTPSLPLDDVTRKVTFTEVVEDETGASAKQLYDRAKRWMIDYYKDNQIKVDMPEEGKLSRSGSFIKSYMVYGKLQNDELFYSITVSIKEGKYKYVITDIISNDGKSKVPAETLNEMLKQVPSTTGIPLVQKFIEGFKEVSSSLRVAMQADASKSDW